MVRYMSFKTKVVNRLPIIRHKALQEFARLDKASEERTRRLEGACEERARRLEDAYAELAQRLEDASEKRAQRLENSCADLAQRLEHMQTAADAKTEELQLQMQEAIWNLRDAKARLAAPEETRNIPIAMALDDAYFLPTTVAIASMLEHAAEGTRYTFHLLVPEDFSAENKALLQESLFADGTHELEFIDMGTSYSEAFCRQERITLPTYYRLSLPRLLPHVDTCLYIDGDTVVMDDLSELFYSDLGGAYLGGVRAAGYLHGTAAGRAAKAKSLHIAALDTYVNAGVLLMNLAAMRYDHLDERFERAAAEEQFPDGDQDILNSVCYGKIRTLPFRFNVMPKYDICDLDAYAATPFLQRSYSGWEWNAGRWNPAIVHYADPSKPWADRSLPYAEVWWNTVDSLPHPLKERVHTAYPTGE